MKIPKSVKIGGRTYKVVLANEWIGAQNLDGEHVSTKKHGHIIYIDSTQSEAGQVITLIHEALHSMNATMNHEFLDSLSNQLYQFLSDNKLLK